MAETKAGSPPAAIMFRTAPDFCGLLDSDALFDKKRANRGTGLHRPL
ncbi:hypothetical protein CHCC20335_3309 [Bacillus paralicheniformis]|nr:hypothetical protein CHCC20335_3309 [Bacillus paralicheniformis]